MSRTARRAGRASLAEAAPVFAALGDEMRLRLVARLCAEGPLSTQRLADDTPLTRQGITKHLEALAGAGVVRDTRRGRERIWELETKRLAEARLCLDRISERWDEAIGRLRALVEDEE